MNIQLMAVVIILLWVLLSAVVAREIFLRKRKEKEIKNIAHHDFVTGAATRHKFTDEIKTEICRADRYTKKLAILFLDLDNFKEINDTHGHKTGDALLKSVADVLKEAVREVDLVARFGGDEFLIMLTDLKRNEDAEVVIRKIYEKLSRSFQINGRSIRVSCSIGVSVYNGKQYVVDRLVREADKAMYKAKDGGRNTFRFYSDEMDK